MLLVRALLICVYVARMWSIEAKLTGTFNKISKLPSIHPDYIRMSPTTDGLHPADLLAIVQDVNNRFDCALLCVKHMPCISTSYIPKGKLCLLSKSAMRVSKTIFRNKYPSPITSFYSELLYDEELFGFPNSKPTMLSHGKPPAICGMNFVNDHLFSTGRLKRIVDGWTPEPYMAPWVGLLLKDNRVRCTAFILSKEATDKFSIWVLSAKHCIVNAMVEDGEDDKSRYKGAKEELLAKISADHHQPIRALIHHRPVQTDMIMIKRTIPDDRTMIDLKPFGFIFGVHDLRFFTQHMIYRKVAAVKLYPDEGIRPKDFALIRLSKPVRFNAFINGLCLPEPREMVELYEGTRCQTCGFGATTTNQKPAVGSNVLQCIDVMIQGSDFDHSLFSDWNSVVKFRAPGFGPYHGDSGSPIFCNTGDPWSFLFALVTGGRSFGLKNSYLTAARISYFMSFIRDNIVEYNQMCCSSK